MRDVREIDGDILLVAEIRAALRDDRADPALVCADTLLDERLSVSNPMTRR